MIRSLAVFFTICSFQVFANATFTSTKTGNWNDPTVWSCSGATCGINASPVCHVNIPCMTDSGDVGDVAVLGNLTHTVTCPVSVACSAGTSPSTDAAASFAIGAVNYDRTDSVLSIAGTLTYAGPVLMPASTWTVSAGATIQYDSSWSSAPTTANYSWGFCHSGAGNCGKMTFSGTTGSHITWNGAGNSKPNASCNNNTCRAGTIGHFSADPAWADQGIMTCSYADFSHIGPTGAGNVGWYLRLKNGSVSVNYCTWSDSNTINISEYSASTGNFSANGMAVLSSVQSNGNYGSISIAPASSSPSVGKSITNSRFQGVFYMSSATAVTSAFSFSNVLFENGLSGVGLLPGIKANFNTDGVMVYNSATGFDAASGSPGGTSTNWVVSRYCNSGDFNQHPFSVGGGSGGTLDGMFIEGNMPFTAGDFLGPGSGGNSVAPLVISHIVYTCKYDGTPNGSFINTSNGVSSTIQYSVQNNTYCSTGSVPATDTAVMGTGWEAGNVVAGAFQAVENNLVYRLDAVGPVEVMCSSADGTFSAAAGSVVYAGNNAIFNHDASSGYCSSVTANSHITTGPTADLSYGRAPVFVDASRRMINADTKYFGDPVATAWVSGTAYTSGSTISDSQPGVYGGANFNWTAISNCTASSANRPMTGSAWIQCWEPAIMSRIRTAVLAGTLYTDSSLGVINVGIVKLLNAWLRQGFAPIEPTLVTAGVGGTYIGAVQPISGGVIRRRLIQ